MVANVNAFYHWRLNKLIKLLTQTKAANEKAEDEAWERQDEITEAATCIGKNLGTT